MRIGEEVVKDEPALGEGAGLWISVGVWVFGVSGGPERAEGPTRFRWSAVRSEMDRQCQLPGGNRVELVRRTAGIRASDARNGVALTTRGGFLSSGVGVTS